MRIVLLPFLLLMSLPVVAQNADALYQQACGPVDATATTVPASQSPQTSPEPGKALVYILQRNEQLSLNTRVGVDGKWSGVLERNAYIPLSLTPGDHHLCVATQNRKKRQAELLFLNAKAGAVYYFVVRGGTVSSNTGSDVITMTFQRLDRDEALYLMASDSFHTSATKP